MQESAFYANKLSRPQPSPLHSHSALLMTAIFSVLAIGIVIGSLFGLQWAAQRGIALGYPRPKVQIAALSANSLTLHQNYQFSAAGSGRELTYDWNFGDQSAARGATVHHTYQNNGSFTVRVTVTDPAGHQATQSRTITVVPPPPQAFFTSFLGFGGYVSFDASNSTADASTLIASYNWDFGDGTTGTTSYSQAAHIYNNTGTYQVTLTVIDGTKQTSEPFVATVVVS